MNTSFWWLIGLWLCTAPLFAQTSEFQLRVQRLGSLRYNNVSDLGWNGWGVQAEHNRMGANRLGWLVGIESGYTGWGNQALAKGGVQYRLVESPHWSGCVRAFGMPGVALFRPRPLFAYRTGAELIVAYTFTRRFGVLAAAGLTHSAVPGYERYGGINRYVDVPLSLGVQWRRQR